MFLVVAIVLGILVFASDRYLDLIGLAGFREEYGGWLGIAFLGTGTAALVQLAAASGRQVMRWANAFRIRQRQQRRLRYLTPDEGTILAAYIQNNTKTLVLKLADGVVAGLSREKLIYQATHITHGDQTEVEYNITPWVWEYLHQHSELLQRHRPIVPLPDVPLPDLPLPEVPINEYHQTAGPRVRHSVE